MLWETRPRARARPQAAEAAPRDRLLGRASALGTLHLWARAGARLITVCGPSGVGKSRLLAEYLRQARLAQPGVEIVACEVPADEDVMSVVGDALGLPVDGDGGGRGRQVLAAAVARGTWRLVLDGAAAAAAVAELLATGALAIVVAAPAALGLPDEKLLELRGLEVPSGDDDVRGFAAVELVTERAGGGVAAERAAELARALDGVPLALEIAAAGPAAGAPRRGRPEDAVARALDWSVSEATAGVLAELATYESALSARGAGVDETALRALAARRLLAEDGAGRWRMAEAVRAWASGRDAARAAAARDRHADLCAAHPGDVGERDLELAVRTLAERRPRRADGMLRAVSTMLAEADLLQAGGARDRHVATIDRLREIGSCGMAPAPWIRLLLLAALVYKLRGRWLEAEDALGEAAGLARAAGDSSLEADALAGLAIVRRATGDADGALAQAEAALAQARAGADRRVEAELLGVLGSLYAERGDAGAAEASYGAAVALLDQLGERRAAAILRGNLGRVQQEDGRLVEAAATLQGALAGHREHGDVRHELEVVAALGMLALEARRADAAELLRDAAARHRRAGLPGAAALLCAGAAAAAAGGDAIEAAQRDAAAARAGLAHADDGQAAAITLHLAHVALAQARAAARAQQEQHAEERLAEVRRLLAEVRQSGEAAPHELAFDLRTAARLLERALAADPRGSALLVGPGADWYQTPDGQRIDLRRRGVLRAVLDRLVDERLRTPGRAISVAALFEACWPGERALPDAAAARVYVVISSLRKLGLRHVIQRRAEGYLLDADAAVARKT